MNHPELLEYGKQKENKISSNVVDHIHCMGCGKYKRKTSISQYCDLCLGLDKFKKCTA